MKTEIVPNAKKFSRRRFGSLLAASPLAAAAAAPPRAFAQSPPRATSQTSPSQAPPATLSREDRLRTANTDRLALSAAIARFEIPISAEPSFVFRP